MIYIGVLIFISLLVGVFIVFAGIQKFRYKSLDATLTLKQAELDGAKQRLDSLYQENLNLQVSISALETEKKLLLVKIKEKEEECLDVQNRLVFHFDKVANELFTENSKKLVNDNKEIMETILSPLKQKITDFENQIYRNSKEHAERHVELRTEVKTLHELNEKITQEAHNLASAIKGDTKIQGVWGELILERVLENSGLIKDREYFVQKSFQSEEGSIYRPDVIIKLPNDRNIIVDSKVSLVSYEKFFNGGSDDDRSMALKAYLLSLKNHISGLSKRSYQINCGIDGLDFVLMFIPIESAFSLAISHDSNIFNYAYENNIVLVSPLTLLTTVRIISNMWQNEYQNRNALEIARQGGNLYDKFVAFAEDIKKIGKQLDSTQNVYMDAVKKLYAGRDCLVVKAEKIRELGAKTSKKIDLKQSL
jgi:DNA recombination protein RmuC